MVMILKFGEKKSVQFIEGNSLYILLVVIIFIATFKYIQFPQPYTFSTSYSGEKVIINENTISQDIILDSNAKWDGGVFGIYFSVDTPPRLGYVEITLLQSEKEISKMMIGVNEIKEGFYELKDLNYTKLTVGGKTQTATVEIRGVNLDSDVYIGLSDNIYNLPMCKINGITKDSTLTQRYHFYFILNFLRDFSLNEKAE